MTTDAISRFLIDNSNVRGEVVQLADSWREILCRADYPHSVKQLLGEAVAATALLAETIKFAGALTLQVRGSGQIELLVVQVTADKTLRGMAKCAEQVTGSSLQELLGDGQMLITIEMGAGKQDYQGVVPLLGERLQDAIGAYFEQSEQLPTQVWLSCDDQHAAGLLLQKLPGEAQDEDLWQRVSQLAATVKPEELLALNADSLLHRLFHEESLRLFAPESLRFACTCTRERTAEAIKAMSQPEAQALVEAEGEIRVQCQFCQQAYVFTGEQVAALFAES